MPTITDLTSLKVHSKALDAELEAVFAKYGLKMGSRRATVYSEEGKLKYAIECRMGSAEDQTEKAKALWERYAPMFDLPADAFGKEVIFNRDQKFRVSGINPNKPKNCVMLTRLSDGKAGFQCPADQLQRVLKYAEIFANRGAAA